MIFHPKYLQVTKKSVPLHCVFHSIRFKVNKGWSKALLLFLYPYPPFLPLIPYLMVDLFAHVEKNDEYCIKLSNKENNPKNKIYA